MRFVFVMDPVAGMAPDKDTSFGFVESASLLGHRCDHCLIQQVQLIDGRTSAQIRRIHYGPDGLRLDDQAELLHFDEADAVFIRKDPPFDAAYLYATLLLEHLRGKTIVLNDPRALRDANEKIYAMQFAAWMPKTIVSSNRDAIHAFVTEVGGKAVIKPLDGAGGFGVLMLRSDDGNARAIVDLLTLEGKQLATVQAFVPEVSKGDKRVLMLDGKLLGAVLRVPPKGDIRANIHVGANVVPTELDARETKLVEAIGPRLSRDGLYFVGLDLIGGKLTEVNVTSPTGIRELSQFEGRRVSDDVIHWVESKAKTINAGRSS